MYNTDQRQDGFCLLYYARNTVDSGARSYAFVHQIIPYCLRTLDKNIDIANFTFTSTTHPRFTFYELREKGISSQLLLSWSASIDLAERYQMFLNNVSRRLSSLVDDDLLFFNCTSSWFGPFCRFAFDSHLNKSFDKIVASVVRPDLLLMKEVRTCYTHLICGTPSLCLDWRDICDRKVDCLDGSDEFNCWQLEINECGENEYRCHNGQCIPAEFFRDVPSSPDCLDQTDEARLSFHPRPLRCSFDPTFQCEEHTCRSGTSEFPFGNVGSPNDLQFKVDITCRNGRSINLLDDVCSITMACLMGVYDQYDRRCQEVCPRTLCPKSNCPSLYEFPYGPILFGHVRFMFTHNEGTLSWLSSRVPVPAYVCYNEKLCAEFLPATVHLNNMTCRHFHELELKQTISPTGLEQLTKTVHNRFRACLVTPNETYYCNHPTMYQCYNSTKCISKHRLLDGMDDCPFNDDENFNESCSLDDAHHRMKCLSDRKEKCLAPLTITDWIRNCEHGDDEREKSTELIENHIYFQTICDGISHLSPITIDGKNETDETECELWQCNNTYTRCDGLWSCKDGADEIDCPSSVCPGFQHSCILSDDRSKVSCLPMTRVGDGIVDCLGASDERRHCLFTNSIGFEYRFRCWNDTKCITSEDFCDVRKDCKYGEDETFCQIYMDQSEASCFLWEPSIPKDVENLICNTFRSTKRAQILYFVLNNMATYPLQLMTITTSLVSSARIGIRSLENNLIVNAGHAEKWRCHQGISIRIRMKDDSHELFCLCPPSYYGDTCQYQNQRVSLTIQIRVKEEWRSIFTILITLIDDRENIEAHDYIEYLPVRDCDVKFNVYLLYSTRPKNPSRNYSVRIHAFNKLTLHYRASWLYSLQFPFLPVHRLSVLIAVPSSSSKSLRQCTILCIHGQCFNHVNDQNSSFCQCSPGWSGVECNIEQKCECAPESLCIDDSICVCPIGRFGPRCYLAQSSCHPNSCFNGGQCVPVDERYSRGNLTKPTCICPEAYSGEQCEYQQTRIEVSFHDGLTIPISLHVHLITVQNGTEHTRTSMMKKIAFNQNSLLFYTSITFNIAFAQILHAYYLIILRKQDIVSTTIFTEIVPSHRCASVNELFNETIANQHLLRRIKLYHIPCQERVELICFYDSIHFCLCDLARRANCFEFDYNMTYDCHGYNFCENGGHCFQDDVKCPSSAICVCPECYYGSRCQFSTKGLTLSLDIILGYQIYPNITINRQPIIVKVTIALTMTMFILGIISNLFSFFTFQPTKMRTVGCGVYLFVFSITSMITMSVLTVKVWILLASQMCLIKHYSFVHGQCVVTDFLLQVLVCSGDWLGACVAIERALTVSKGITFDKVKSKRVAKWVVLFVFLFTVSTRIHDPIHRQLINDEEEQRTWCVTKYTSSLQIFDGALNVFHFAVPFGINCITALVIIVSRARTRSTVQQKQSYKLLLREQFHNHKHLLISPFILVLLALPRLIISFLFGCMKSARNPWFYLIGYFASFIPSMLTFVVFVLPSKMYKTQLKQLMKQLMKRFWPH